ncbi:MAG: Flp family type IVb pilin [Lentisphaeria bacterium]|jgi:Flp pilus assembly pilin Flp
MFKQLIMRKTGVTKRSATFVEYALLVGLIAIVVGAAVAIFGKEIAEIFSALVIKIKELFS